MQRTLLLGIALLFAFTPLRQARGADTPTEQQIIDILGRIGDLRGDARDRAILDITAFGGAAVPYLLQAVRSPDVPRRSVAAQVLTQIKLGRELVIPALTGALDDANKDVRTIATETLGAIGPDAAAAIPKLITKFDDPYLRRPAPQAVAKIGIDAVIPILNAIRSPNHLIRRGALEALSEMIPDPELRAAQQFAERVVGGKPSETDPPAKTIPLSGGIIDTLIAALKDPEDDVRRAATTVLGHLENRAPAAIPALLGLLADPDGGVRISAQNALRKLRPLPCKEFLDALADPDQNMHHAASALLYSCQPLSKSVVYRLLEILKSPDPDHGLWASHVFEYLRSDAIPELLPGLDSPNVFVRRSVARALFLVPSSSDQVLPALAKALTDPDDIVRKNTLDSLSRVLGRSASESASRSDKTRQEAILKITALLADKNPLIRASAATALAAIGPLAMGASSALETTLRDPDPEVRRNSAEALGKIKDPHAVRSLVAALRDTETSVALAAASSLGEMGSAAETALTDLASVHKNKSTERQVESAIKTIAEALESDLQKLADEEIRRAARDLANARSALLSDGVFVDTLEAVKRSEAALAKELASRSPLMRRILDAVEVVLLFLFVYGVALPILILLYPRSEWARTAVNSGFFRFPLLHRTILGASWARRRLFKQAALLESRDFQVKSYIPQSVLGASTHDGAIPFEDSGSALRRIFADGRHAMICGRSGTGKSVLLRKIAHDIAGQYLEGQIPALPVLIDFHTSPIAGRALRDLIRDRLRRAEIRLPDATLDHLIDQGDFLILADSLNELAEDELKPQLNTFLNQDAANLVLLASQNDFLKRRDVSVFLIDAVTAEQAKKYLEKELGADIWDQLPPEARRLATSPQDLAILATIVNKNEPGAVPSRRAALYRRLLEEDSVFENQLEVDSSQIKAVFGLAFQLLKREPPVVPSSELGTLVRRELADQGGEPDDSIVKEVIDALNRSSLFKTQIGATGASEQLFTFRHELVGKYLSARHLLRGLITAETDAKIEEISELAFDRRWQEVFTFVVEELDDNEKLNSLLARLVDRRRKKEGRSIAHAIVATALATKPACVSRAIRNRFVDWKIEQERLDAAPDEISGREGLAEIPVE